MRLFITVKTNAREERVEQEDETHFSVSVKAAPLQGKANVAVIRAVARHLGLAPSRLTLRSGATNKHKVLECQ